MTTKIKLILPAFFIAGLFLIASCGASEEKTDETVEEQVEETNMEVEKNQYTCSMHPEVVQDEPGDCPECKMALVEKTETSEEVTTDETAKKQYTCSMHPDVVKDEPGDCPECKMALVEKTDDMKEEEPHEGHNH